MKIKHWFSVMLAAFLLVLSVFSAGAAGIGSAASITFLQGDLSITEVSEITFKPSTISYDENTYPAIAPVVTLEVSDLRGTGDGWAIVASAESFMTVEDEPKASLPGASITFLQGTASSTMPNDIAPTVFSEIILECDGQFSSPVASANKDYGMGIWQIKWVGITNNNANVALKVPEGVATVGVHTTTITWAFTAVP